MQQIIALDAMHKMSQNVSPAWTQTIWINLEYATLAMKVANSAVRTETVSYANMGITCMGLQMGHTNAWVVSLDVETANLGMGNVENAFPGFT